MNTPVFNLVGLAGILAGAALFMGFGLIPSVWLNRRGTISIRIIMGLANLTLFLALLADLALVLGGPVQWNYPLAGPVHFSLYFDNFAGLIMTLAALLLVVVIRFTRHYLAGEPRLGYFAKWLSFTGGAVLLLVIAGNLLQFSLAWSAVSWGLHKLLLFYPDRPGARLAARKKFIISRLGDLGLLAVLVLTLNAFGTWDFAGIFAAVKEIHPEVAVRMPWQLPLISSLLVLAAMMKSAQFPFHSWLPDTMETPTPVSALMHAGIINAGGFLIIRLHSLVALSPSAMGLLTLVGAFTAVFAGLVMLTHASVKRALAFSTVAQMGFMMFECGLGVFSLAALHLVAHSLYKAHTFLACGEVPQAAKTGAGFRQPPPARLDIAGGALLVAIVLVGLLSNLLLPGWQLHTGYLIVGAVFTLAVAHGLWLLWSRLWTLFTGALGILLAALATVSYLGLHLVFDRILGGIDLPHTGFINPPGGWVLTGCLLLLAGWLVGQV
ncbi:MAG TPA: proton-conducting transporter membrane subunit, partial [Verrucomicrobiae bacterium]